MFCRIDYFSTRVGGEAGSACQLLARLAAQRVDLIAAVSAPDGPRGVALHLFPADPVDLAKAARAERIALEGPRGAVLVQGSDHSGALAAVLSKLAAAGIEPSSAFSMRDGRGRFGCVIPLDPRSLEPALKALRLEMPERSFEAERRMGSHVSG